MLGTRFEDHYDSTYKICCDQFYAAWDPRLFNCMPKAFRTNDSSYENFKYKLDDILEKVPDLPSLLSYAQVVSNNSLL